MVKTKYIKSPLNYTGGKHKLLPQLMPLMLPKLNNDSTFVDLFTGGGNVIVNIPNDCTRVANDYCSQVIEIYKTFQEKPIEYIIDYINNQIKLYNLSKENSEGYLEFRKKYNEQEQKNPLDLFVLICYSFNNQIRFNSKGEYNMPFGKNRSSFNSSIEKNLINFHNNIKNINLLSVDFREVNFDILDEGDYVYCDPPYLITCASYNEQNGWNERCENDLLKLLVELDKKGVYFGLSNVLSNKGKTNEILLKWIDEHPNFTTHHLNHSYSNCSYHAKDKESKTDEVFITNY